MEADVILEGPGRRINLDAKYYREAFGGHYVGGKLLSPHLYQPPVYLRNREATAASGARHEGMLLYATVDEPVSQGTVLEGFSIRARSINLGQKMAGHPY